MPQMINISMPPANSPSKHMQAW